MKKSILMVGLMMAAGLVCAQVNERGNKNFTGEVNFDGDWKVKGTKVTSSATELNISDGLTNTTANLNKAGLNMPLTLADTYMFIGNASAVAAAATPAAVRTNLSLVIGVNAQAYDADLDAVSLRSLANMTNLAPAGVNGEAVVKTTVFTGGVTGTWDNLTVSTLPAISGASLTALNAANIAAASVASAFDGAAITNLDGANLQDGSVVASKIDPTIVTNVLADGMVLPAVDGSAVTNMAPATAFPGYGVCVVTNLDIDGTTNICTYIGTIARNQ